MPILMRPVIKSSSSSALHTATGCTHKVVPILRINRMRNRATNANKVYHDNLKLYSRILQTKSTIPRVSKLVKDEEKRL